MVSFMFREDFIYELFRLQTTELPPCEVGRLDEIVSALQNSLSIQPKKDAMQLALENENYIPKLLDLFVQLEKDKDVPNLQKLYEIFKSIFLLNRNSLFDILLCEQAIWNVIGVFEYDPTGAAVREYQQAQLKSKTKVKGDEREEDEESLKSSLSTSSSVASTSSSSGGNGGASASSSASPKPSLSKANKNSSYFTSIPPSLEPEANRLIREKRHRQYLRNVARFKEVVPMEKSGLVSRIHLTYRVQYIQDVILPTPSLFEDNMLSTLNSLIFLNKVRVFVSIF